MPIFGRWSTIRAFGSIKYFNLSYVALFGIPILHEIYSTITKSFCAPSFPSTLRWLYIASLSYAIAIALYQWFCPPEIKRFGKNEDEYLRAEQNIYNQALPRHRLNVVLANLDPDLDHDVYEKIHALMEERNSAIGDIRARAQEEIDRIIAQLHPDAVQRYLLKHYNRLDLSKGLIRWACFVLYLLGSGVLLALLTVRSYGVIWKE